MKPDPKSWEKLVAAARRAPAGDEAAPYGFSTRVAALAFEPAQPRGFDFARMALRAAAVAGVLAAVAVAANFKAITGVFDDYGTAATDDPIAEVVDMGS